MAYSFNGSNQSLQTSSSPTTTDTITLACWFNPTNATDNDALICISDKDSTDDEYYISTLSGKVRCTKKTGGTTSGPSSSASYTAGEWAHAAATFADNGLNTDLAIFLDGAKNSTLDAGNVTTSLFDNISIGDLNRPTDILHFTGNLAECAVWDMVLPDAEIAMLALGISPLMLTHRLKNLVFYDGLLRDLNRNHIGPTLTNNNSAGVVSHPRVIYPSAKIYSFPSAGGGVTPLYDEYYKTLLSGSMM